MTGGAPDDAETRPHRLANGMQIQALLDKRKLFVDFGSLDPKSIETSLRDEIQRGLIAPGTVLKQEQLAAAFAVSRQPVRHALERLVATGFLERRSDRSLAVVGLSPRQAAELVGVRVALETSALRLSLPDLDAAALRKARHVADEILYAEEPAEIEELDVAFHRLIYSRCGNERMLAMIDSLRREGRRIYVTQLADARHRERLHAEHLSILEACEHKDADRAALALVAHLRGTTSSATEE
ncbi:MAG TPA: GntR family transcriptional regulator, partial [Saliniramus sp.]|nr:GntR family transcriptional regulator [Saliniramus sp.]